MITDPNDYFIRGCGRCKRFDTPDCSTRAWAAGLAHLRRICTEAGLSETAKWGHPCYMHAGRNIAILGAFRDSFRLTFMNGSLLTDSHGILEKRGEQSRVADQVSFTDPEQVLRLEQVLRAYLDEAKGHAEAGRRPEKAKAELVWPSELVDALDDDPELAQAFQALTPGRQRSYVLHLEAAKKSETRTARIIKARDRILAGKGATER